MCQGLASAAAFIVEASNTVGEAHSISSAPSCKVGAVFSHLVHSSEEKEGRQLAWAVFVSSASLLPYVDLSHTRHQALVSPAYWYILHIEMVWLQHFLELFKVVTILANLLCGVSSFYNEGGGRGSLRYGNPFFDLLKPQRPLSGAQTL